MKTELKDVLYLYKDCKGVSEEQNCQIGEIDFVDDTVHLYYESSEFDKTVSIEMFKPILRPLSDVSDLENKEFSKLYYDLMETQSFGMKDITVHAGMTKAFLQKGFDLFGLIASGQAIDKTKEA